MNQGGRDQEQQNQAVKPLQTHLLTSEASKEPATASPLFISGFLQPFLPCACCFPKYNVIYNHPSLVLFKLLYIYRERKRGVKSCFCAIF